MARRRREVDLSPQAKFVMGCMIFLGILTIAGLIYVIVRAVELDKSSNNSTAQGMSPEATAPIFRIERNMMKLSDDVMCVESAAVPPGMKTKFGAKRVEGRFHLLRAQPKGHHRSTSMDQAPVVGSCSNHISEGARWKVPHKVLIDPTNGDGISRQLFVDAMWKSVQEIESRLDQTIIEGQDQTTCVDGFDSNSPDGKNEFMFGFIEEPGVLAVTVIWGTFSGPINQREIVETDILFNLHFPWGNASIDSQAFGLHNIGTHEVNHAYGEGHTQTHLATMFPTASPGETHKRDLLACEGTGLCDLYGEGGKCVAGTGTGVAPFVDIGNGSRCGAGPVPSAGVKSPVPLLGVAVALAVALAATVN